MFIVKHIEKMNLKSGIVIKSFIETSCWKQISCIPQTVTKMITQGKFVCTLNLMINDNNTQLTIKLTGKMMEEVSKINVKLFDRETPDDQWMTKEEDDWIYTLIRKQYKCSNCSNLYQRPKSCDKYPSYVLYIHLKKPKSYGSTIFQNIGSLLNNQTSMDITFEIGGNKLPAHSLIVGASSPVLAAMFQSDFKENRTKIVKMEDTTVEVFQQFLNYLYTNEVPEMRKKGIAAGLFELADKYEVDSLKEESAIFLAEQLNVENAVETLIAAHLHSSERLLQKTLSFMSKNGLALCSRPDWLQLMENYPKLCFQANQLMVAALADKCDTLTTCFLW